MAARGQNEKPQITQNKIYFKPLKISERIAMKAAELGKQKVLLYDPSRCTGCRYCEIACSYYHFKEFNLEKAHLHIIFEEKIRSSKPYTASTAMNPFA